MLQELKVLLLLLAFPSRGIVAQFWETPSLPIGVSGSGSNKNCPGANEYYACAPWYCPNTCSDYFRNGMPQECMFPSPFICQYSCRCYPGYFKNAIGTCVPVSECNAGCSDVNAILVACPDPCPLTCDNVLTGRPPCNKFCVASGCACKTNYVLDSNGRCVPPSTCPNLKCPPGRTLKRCVDWCSIPQTCDGYFNFIDCNGVQKECEPKCLCPPGLLDNGTACLTPNECCGVNAEAVNCGWRCDGTCEDGSPHLCNSMCLRQTCVCKPGYVRPSSYDTINICIKPEECKNYIKCKGQNEEFNLCLENCKPTCKSIATGELPPGCKNSTTAVKPESCHGGCDCKPGFVRNNNNTCVRPESCPPIPCEDKNAIRTPCGNPCPLTCDNIENPPQRCIEKCIVNGCVCKEGFVLDINGKCVEVLKCPCKGANQTRTACGDFCPKTCDNKDIKGPRICPAVCFVNGCTCKAGYVRNQAGECILPADCPLPPCGDKNAISMPCANACPLTCVNFANPPKNCTKPCIINGCVCKEGFLLNSKGKCVEAVQCPPCNDGNAIRKPCGDPCPLTCENLDDPPKVCTKPCIPNGCACKEGFVLTKTNGFCVDALICPCKQANESRTACGDFCPTTCDNVGDKGPRICPAVCFVNGCTCKTGYARNQTGVCIRTNDCPLLPCEDKNAVREYCASACPWTCDNYDVHLKYCSSSCIVHGCVCKDDFVLDSNGKCVQIMECPCKGGNETRSECGDPCPVTCDNKDSKEPRDCPDVCNQYDCICKTGYVRSPTEESYTGICILPEDCPLAPCEDENAIRMPCANACPLTCDNYDNPPQNCTKQCIINGCVCNEGFVLDSNGKCVKIIDCPCKEANETRKACGDPCPTTCDNKDDKEPRICPAVCLVNGCACKAGYVRNKDGKCILPEECALPPCKDINAIRTPCGNPCPLTCNKLDNPPQVCTKQCIINGCVCKEGFVLDDKGQCVDALQCPCKNKNEKRTPCGDYCPLTCDNKDVTPRVCPKICLRFGCTCKDGFVRDSNQTCVEPEKCPKNCTEPNTVWNPCGSACPPKCTDRKPVCNKICVPGCFCLPGYLIDDQGRCVNPEDCPTMYGD